MARRVPEVGEVALADLIVGLLHENNGHMCACQLCEHVYNLDPAYKPLLKPLLKRIGGIKGLCSRHSERLQYEGNAGGGVVCLGILPPIFGVAGGADGGAGLDPEVDRPSGAATDAPAANQNIGAASQPSRSGANSPQNLGGASADATGEQQQQQAQHHKVSSAADALAPLPPPTVELEEEALADHIVGLLHENNGHMCASQMSCLQHLDDLDPAYKPLLKRLGGIKGLCSRHSERLQYEGNAGGGVVRLGILPPIIGGAGSAEGGAGLDPDGAAQYQPTVEELVAAIKEVKEKNPEFGIKRVHKELKVRPRASPTPFSQGVGVVEAPAALRL